MRRGWAECGRYLLGSPHDRQHLHRHRATRDRPLGSPEDYGIFETKVLEDLMRLFNSAQIKQATGDVFGRIYEYFLAKFSIQKALLQQNDRLRAAPSCCIV